LAGEIASEKSLLLVALTVTEALVVLTVAPLVPVMAMVKLPVGVAAAALTVKIALPPGLTVAVESEAVTLVLLGVTARLRLTGSVKVPSLLTLILNAVEVPALIVLAG